MHYEV